MRKNFYKPYRIKKKKSIFQNRFFWSGFLILLMLIAVFYLVYFSSFFQVKKITIASVENIPKQDINLIIEKELNKQILFFKTRSIFLINQNEIKKDVLNNFPEISKVTIDRRLPSTLNVSLTQRQEMAIWYQDEKSFLLDNEGIIFKEITEAESDLLKIKNLVQEIELKLGNRVIEKEKLNQIFSINSWLKNNLKISLKTVNIISGERLNMETFDGWEIYLNPQGDIDWQLTKLKAVLEEIPFEKRKNIEHIELRFGNLAPVSPPLID